MAGTTNGIKEPSKLLLPQDTREIFIKLGVIDKTQRFVEDVFLQSAKTIANLRKRIIELQEEKKELNELIESLKSKKEVNEIGSIVERMQEIGYKTKLEFNK